MAEAEMKNKPLPTAVLDKTEAMVTVFPCTKPPLMETIPWAIFAHSDVIYVLQCLPAVVEASILVQFYRVRISSLLNM
jgi:hypothetical protein